MYYYKIVSNYDDALVLQDNLLQHGIDKNQVSIIVHSDSNEVPPDVSPEALKDTDQQVEQAPRGTVGLYGATFSVLTGMASGALLLGFGPIAAAVGSAAFAAGGVGMLLSGIGVPEEKHDEALEMLKSGDVLVAVDAPENLSIAELMR